ncbi:hypothetical protein QWY99_09390 [Flavobacterium branchiarum]|uniref:Uncharacterized protein n=1 Tax=Flavobacterium branchiarum TaxID=1114870 RepID=A0ABV5FQC4_9FLAO|nr:hypothetical protein [Flavobacterium branchiarum]MDN3673261.1 hypothetical protein [Flavobacterium branchiarum]
MKQTVETRKTIDIPKDAKAKFSTVASNIKDKKLFQTKIGAAKRSLEGFKTLPI